MDVAEIKLGELDSTGSTVEEVYARNLPHYAIYRAGGRVMIHFADATQADEELKQRNDLSQLNPLRAEIDGLIDDWRNGKADDVAAAVRYQRRMAYALALALQNDLPNAMLYLTAVKADVDGERASRARRFYVIYSAGTAAILLLVAALIDAWAPSIRGVSTGFPGDVRSLMIAAGTGAIGAFFSVAISIRERTPLNDLRLLDTICDAVLRIVIGFVGGMVLYALFRTQVVSSIAFGNDAGALKPDAIDAAEPRFNWMLVAVIGFIAGFVERLVGNLLAKSALAAGVAVPLPPGPPDRGPVDRNLGGGDPNAGNADGGDPDDGDPGGGGDDASDPAEDAAADGCDAAFDPTQATDDEELPPATGGLQSDVPSEDADLEAEAAAEASAGEILEADAGAELADDAEAGGDGCDVEFDAAEATPDEELPAATGGVSER